jgi:hypothetical protein
MVAELVEWFVVPDEARGVWWDGAGVVVEEIED